MSICRKLGEVVLALKNLELTSQLGVAVGTILFSIAEPQLFLITNTLERTPLIVLAENFASEKPRESEAFQ